MPNYNPGKLHKALAAAGLPVVGVTSDGNVQYSRELKAEEQNAADGIITGHDPYDRDAARRKAYLNAGIDAERLIVALWEKFLEGNDLAVVEIQDIREAIKEAIP